MQLNSYQRAILMGYHNGQHSHLAAKKEIDLHELDEIGDPLLTYLMVELIDADKPDGLQQTINTFITSRDELDVCIRVLEQINNAISSRLSAG